MRNAAAMFMAAMMAVSLSGCTGGGKTADSTTAAVTEAKETTVEATTAADTAADSEETQKAAQAENEAEKSGESYHIAYLCPSMDTPFWRYMATGVEREAEKLGNVTVTTYDSKNSADIQYTNAQDVIVKGVDGIVISPTDSASCVAVLGLAEEAGIPVAISDIGTDSGEYVTFIKTNNLKGAEEGGKYLASLLKEGDKVAEIVGPQARQNQQDRKAGFEKGVGTANVEIVDFRQMERENRSEGESYAQDYLTAYPDLKAIFCTSDDASLGVLAACQGAGRNEVMIFGFDSNEELLAAVREGTIVGTSTQQPLLMGARALDGVIDHLDGKEVEQLQEIETLLVTKDNIDDVYDILSETAMVIE